LTDAQVETLLLYKRVLSGELTLKQAGSLREGKAITAGAFHRVAGQGRRNIESSVSTVAVSLLIGYLKIEDLRRLLDMVAQSTALGEEGLNQVAPLIDALIERIVM
jgi:hypothetical protein